MELLKKLREKKNPLQKGFTLVELMIVVAIIGLLAAASLPRFLGARNTADLGAKVGEQVGLAKECAVYVASGGVGTVPGTNCSTSGGTFSAAASATSDGARCLGTTANGVKTVTVTVAADGGMSCSLT